MTQRTCKVCGGAIPERSGPGRPRLYCDQHATPTERTRQNERDSAREHGTVKGSKQHYARSEAPCEPCRQAANDHARERAKAKRVSPTECRYCGSQLPKGQRIQCGTEACRKRHNAERTRPHVERRRQRYGREDRVYKRTCAGCGTRFMGGKPSSTYCSRACVGRERRLPVLHPNPAPSCMLPRIHPARRPPDPKPQHVRVWYEPECTWCGRRYLTTRPSWYCSDPCHTAADRLKRQLRAAYIKSMERGQRGGHLSLNDWGRLLTTYQRRCAYCRTDDTVEIEHVIPICRNGSNTARNVVPACRACNQEKSTLTADEWLASDRPRVAHGIVTRHELWPSGHAHGPILDDPMPNAAAA